MGVEEKRKAFGTIMVDLNSDLEQYRGLDELIGMNALKISKEDKKRFLELCNICPNMKIMDDFVFTSSSVQEYKEGEAWIDSVLEKMNPNWKEVQKVAYIDTAIGRKISYSPDFDTEAGNQSDCRALWKMVHNSYGVCNGIAQLEHYMLQRAGIDSEIVESKTHSFLKLKNITLPTEDGKEVVGDTILDGTWNLAANRYRGFPDNFCITYEEARKHDMADGKDYQCHLNDEALQKCTIGISESALRDVYASIGIANKDGSFPFKVLVEKAETIANEHISEKEKVRKQLNTLSEYCPEFATCQNSTAKILGGVLLTGDKIHFYRCIVDRVYNKEDENKRPILYVYMELPNAEKIFYIADKEQARFKEMSRDEFEAHYECYQVDIEKYHGRRWQIENSKERIDLSRNSGKIASQEQLTKKEEREER